MSWTARFYLTECVSCRGPLDRDLLTAKKCTACLAASAARRAQYPPRVGVTTALRKRILERDGGRCRHCGVVVRESKVDRYDRHPALAEIDHIVPVALGGPTVPGNLQLLCKTCNRRKGAKAPPGPRRSLSKAAR